MKFATPLVMMLLLETTGFSLPVKPGPASFIKDYDSTEIRTSKFAMSDRRLLDDRNGLNLNTCRLGAEIATNYHELICTDKIETLLGIPLIRPAVFTSYISRLFQYDRCEYKGSEISYPEECFDIRFESNSANCYVANIEIQVSHNKLEDQSGIGFYSDGEIFHIAKENLVKSSSFVNTEGQQIDSFAFAAIDMCWAGSMSSSLNWRLEMKPFLYKIDGSTLVRTWEAINPNHQIYNSKPSI